MLETLEIEAFRCFQDLKVAGLSRVNLVGGQNNSGKTALLEAILLLSTPPAQAVLTIKETRREPVELTKALPERAWDNFFFNRNKSNKISLLAKHDNHYLSQELSISFDHPVKQDFLIENGIQDPEDLLVIGDGATLLEFELSEYTGSGKTFLMASHRGIFRFGGQLSGNESPLIPSNSRAAIGDLTKAYDRARLDDKDVEVLKAFQVLDPLIVKIESFYVGEPTLYLTRSGQLRFPITAFGDAINRIADIILRLINNRYGVILVDEIENGIHYSSQVQFWQFLIGLAEKLNVQIFATTHSFEMIRAFATAGLELDPTSCTYIELARHEATGKITAINRDLETLNYALEHGKGVRGE